MWLLELFQTINIEEEATLKRYVLRHKKTAIIEVTIGQDDMQNRLRRVVVFGGM